MLPAERRRRIVELVTERDGCSVADLASELDFSKATIRRDLQELEDEGQVERSHGGAVPVSSVGRERSYGQREVQRLDAKEAIADRAVEEIRDDQVVCFDAGTTTMALAQAVPADAVLDAVTNMPELATVLMERDVDVSVTGGRLRPRTRALVGPSTETFLERRHIDLLFLGTNSVLPSGLTTPDEDEAAVKSLMVERASRVVLVADGSKFGEQSYVAFADLDDVDVLVTDEAPVGDLRAALEDSGVSVAEAEV